MILSACPQSVAGIAVAPVAYIRRDPFRFVYLLTCYLDDSGTHPESPFVTMAGYVTHFESWDRFEVEARDYLDANGVSCVHAKEFVSNDGEFKGWTVDRRLAFLEGLYALFRPRVLLGVSAACLKSQFAARKAETGLGKRQSPIGFAFVAAMNAVIDDELVGPVAKWDGISFVLEDGNRNNSGIIESYGRIKRQHKADFLKSISVVGKRDCVAIQMADLMAYFSRRQAHAMENNNREPVEQNMYLKVMRQGIRDVGRAATDFYAGEPV